jgi:hypothetical protein
MSIIRVIIPHFQTWISLYNNTMVVLLAGSAVFMAIGYGLDDWRVAVRVPSESRIFAYPSRAAQMWIPTGPPPYGN